MGKRRSRENQSDYTQLIRAALDIRYKGLAEDILAAEEGRLDLKGLQQLKEKLEARVTLSKVTATIAECHPSTGKYKRALPKGYFKEVTLLNHKIDQSIALSSWLAEKETIASFNQKPKKVIQEIKKICEAHDLNSAEQIATFFHQQKLNLDLEAVGDYISGPHVENQAVLKAFTRQIDLTGQSFTQSLRLFLKTFKLPGEAQKIDRLVESFSEAYCEQNPGGHIANQGAGYVLAFQTIMLNTDLHNSSIAEAKKMTFDQLRNNLRGCNNESDFDETFLKEIYKEIKAHPFELNFIKVSPGYELVSPTLHQHATFKQLDSLLKSPKVGLQTVFHGISDQLEVSVDKPKSWLNIFTGYNGTITLTKDKVALATIQVYSPSFFSRWLFGEHAKVIVQPVCNDGKVSQEAIDLAAKVAAGFSPLAPSVKATYDYLEHDLQSAYDKECKLVSVSQSHHSLWNTAATKDGQSIQTDNAEDNPKQTK